MAGVTLLSLGKRGGYLAGVFPRPMSSTTARRSGRVQALRGVAFQSDAKSDIGAWFIRPFEALDRRVAGLHHTAETAPLAMHAGLHVALDDGREYVVEQLILSPYTLLSSPARPGRRHHGACAGRRWQSSGNVTAAAGTSPYRPRPSAASTSR